MRLYTGTIISCDDLNSVHKYLVEDEGIIKYVGDHLPEIYNDIPVEYLGDGALIPSFADTHLHFASMSVFNAGLNVMDVKSNSELKEKLRAFLPTTKEKVVIAFGASPHSVRERTLISKNELDDISCVRPIMVVKYDGHACIVNSSLINQLPDNTKKLRGYDAETGEMNQEAFFSVTDYVTDTIGSLALINAMKKAIDYMADKGIGLIHTVSGVGYPRDLDVDLERYVGRGASSGFQTRVFFQTMDVEKAIRRKLPRIGGCFATALDGCFGSKDAALLEPYEGTNDYGVLYYTDDEVTEFCKKANRAGLQIELHAIGDAAFNQAAKAIKAALDDYPREDHRHGIIHGCLPTEEGLQICGDYQIHIPMQTAFLDWPQEPDWYLKEILGEEREKRLNPLRTVVDKGIVISAGSDAPCTDPQPMLWVHNACNHPDKEEALSVEEALRMATYMGYWTSFDEQERGSLEVGKVADMVILDRNPLEVSKERLKEIGVTSLILGGKTYRGQRGSGVGTVIRGMLRKGKI